MNNPIFTDGFLRSVGSQLQKTTNLTERVIIDAAVNSFHDIDITYDAIKKANGHFHKAINTGAAVKRTQLLDIVAKAMGHENHHAMKKYFEATTDAAEEFSIEYDPDAHPLMNLYAIKDEMFVLFDEIGVHRTSFWVQQPKNLEFMFEVRRPYIHTKVQQRVNRFFKSYGFKTYKNTLSFRWAYRQLETKPAAEIYRRFNSFFTPLWNEAEGGTSTRGKIALISGDRITYDKLYCHVDDYSTDTPWNTVQDALWCILKTGTPAMWRDLVDILTAAPAAERHFTEASTSDCQNFDECAMRHVKRSISYGDIEDIGAAYDSETFILRIDGTLRPIFSEIEMHTGRSISTLIKSAALRMAKTRWQGHQEGKEVVFDFDSYVQAMAWELLGEPFDTFMDDLVRYKKEWSALKRFSTMVFEHSNLLFNTAVKYIGGSTA